MEKFQLARYLHYLIISGKRVEIQIKSVEREGFMESVTIETMMQEYMNGNKSWSDDIIKYFLPQVKRLAASMAHKQPNVYEDLLSEASLKLVQILRADKIYNDTEHFKKYIFKCIRGAVSGYLEHLPIVHIPRKKIHDTFIPKFVQIEKALDFPIKKQEPEFPTVTCKDTKDELIVLRLTQNYTYREIGDELKISINAVSKRVIKMRKKYAHKS